MGQVKFQVPERLARHVEAVDVRTAQGEANLASGQTHAHAAKVQAKSNTEAIVLFSKGTAQYRLLGAVAKFGHCDALVKKANGEWLYLSAEKNKVTRHNIGHAQTAELLDFYHSVNRSPVLTTAELGTIKSRELISGTCVSFVKRMIGLKRPDIVLPVQLYWHLSSK